MKNFLKNTMFKRTLLGLSLALVMIGGVFINNASAAATTTVATGGTAVSLDTSSFSPGTGAWTTLTGPVFTEGVAGDIATGTHSITLPAGWEFNTAQNVTISVGGGTELALSAQIVTPGATAITFYVSTPSSSGTGSLTFSNIKVRPTGNSTSTGSMVLHTGVINGVVIDTTNLGTLTTVVGAVSKVTITTPPTATTVYGSVFADQPIVKTQDRFGNNSVTGLASSEIVTLTLSTGTGTLQGTTTMDIGTGGGSSGSVTFSGLTVGGTSAVGTGKKLRASASTLTTSAESATFDITAKTLTASATGINKVYNATTTAAVTLSTDKLGSDDVTATSTSATFDTKNIGTGKTVTVSGISISGTYATNYSLASTSATTTANITVATLTVSATGINKVYNATTTAGVTLSSDKFAGDTVDATSTSAIFDTKDIGTGKPIAVSGISISGADAT
ncbi:MAG: YDG domain-containing protein, partial [Chloroflexi bacterium]|nr:YDG domain-containing protein [Chloroflexota bacterium]